MASPELPFCTYRFSNLPKSISTKQLQTIVPLQGSERVVSWSLVPNPDTSTPSSQIGIVTWSSIPRELPDVSIYGAATLKVPMGSGPQGYELEGSGVEIDVDSHFRGLTPLGPSAANEDQVVEFVQRFED